MQIAKVQISNYRNLDGANIVFHPKVNFLVGENDLGKSNLLGLFEALFNKQYFLESDFGDPAKPIEINFSLRLSDIEKGVFDDHFDPADNTLISLCAKQEISDVDGKISFFWTESQGSNPLGIPVSLTQLRQITYILYDSQKIPKEELTFRKGRGGGRFLSYLIDEFIGKTDLEIDISPLKPAIESIQSVFDKLQPLRRQGLGLHTGEENSLDFAARALRLTGADGLDIYQSGYGVQFSTLLIFSILEQLVRQKQSARFQAFEEERGFFTKTEYKVFSEIWFTDTSVEQILQPITSVTPEGYFLKIEDLDPDSRNMLAPKLIEHIKHRKHISMVLGLDEPEIHLHPYMQRSLLKYIHRLINNDDADFLFLLKRFFDVDAINGQVIVVTHSPAALFDEHKQIIRFHKEQRLEAASGCTISLDSGTEKQLLLNFPYIKEAFFSRCVIVVEGDTELGALPLWACKTIGDLDEYGITILRGVGGIENIRPVTKLLNHFGIPNVSIIDKDDQNDSLPGYASITGLRTTQYRDFEEELFETIWRQDPQLLVLQNLVKEYEAQGLKKAIQPSRLENIASTYGIVVNWDGDPKKRQYSFENTLALGNKELTKVMFLAWLNKQKNIVFGRILGHTIEADFIPETYKGLFRDAKKKVTTP